MNYIINSNKRVLAWQDRNQGEWHNLDRDDIQAIRYILGSQNQNMGLRRLLCEALRIGRNIKLKPFKDTLHYKKMMDRFEMTEMEVYYE